VSATAPRVSQLRALEAEAVFVIREVVAELSRPVLLFSGGKDSIVLLRLAEKAFRPLPLPFPVLHVDTGHNFPEVIEFRDRRPLEAGHRLIVASVQTSIDTGRVKEEEPGGSRNRLAEELELPSIYFAHRRRVLERDGLLLAESEWIRPAQPSRRRRRRSAIARLAT
jgi:sulfate adenylyltransferase subunit 2